MAGCGVLSDRFALNTVTEVRILILCPRLRSTGIASKSHGIFNLLTPQVGLFSQCPTLLKPIAPNPPIEGLIKRLVCDGLNCSTGTRTKVRCLTRLRYAYDYYFPFHSVRTNLEVGRRSHTARSTARRP